MAEQFEFWIGDTRLPVTPGELSISHGLNVEKINLADGNKLTRFQGKELKTISFTASFPTVSLNRPNYAFSDAADPLYYWNHFTGLMNKGIPFELMIIQKPTVKRVIFGHYYIESMKEEYSADDGSEMEISFSLLQFSHYKTKKVYKVENTTSSGTLGKTTSNVLNWAYQNYTKGPYGPYIDFDNISDSNSLFATTTSHFLPTLTEEETGEDMYRLFAIDESEIPEYHNIDVERSSPFESQNITEKNTSFQSLAIYYYNDINKAQYIKNLNPSLSRWTITEDLPQGTQVKLK